MVKLRYVILILLLLILPVIVSADNISSDSFESNTFSGGTGWIGNWIVNEGYAITTYASHDSGTYSAFMSGKASIQRVVNTTSYSSVKIGFWVWAVATPISVNYTINVTETNLVTITNTSGFTYYEYSLPSGVTTIKFINDGYASVSYFDDVRINGTITPICVENWVSETNNISSCQTNNTILTQKTYNDNNSCNTYDDLPLDNGTIEENYCNYCNADWIAHTGGIHECQLNETRYSDYYDANNCYIITGLIEDAPPLDIGTWVSCTYYTNDFTCSIAEQPYLKDKMEYSCILPNSINDYECINSVTYNLDDVLQVNPQIQQKTDSFLGLNNNIEGRDSFVTKNGILNAYFTDKNLVAETPFTITTTCSNGNQTIVNQKLITPTYKNIDEVPTYALWVKTNAGYLVVGFIMLLILIWLTTFLVGQSKYR